MNILITGGTGGVGEAIVRKTAKNADNQVYFTYFRSLEKAQQLEKEFGNTHAIRCDFASNEDITNLVSKIPEIELDALINNAIVGIQQAHFHKIDVDNFLQSFVTEVLPVIRITQQAISIFRKRKAGKIINILTEALLHPPIGYSQYAANKAYILALSKSWAIENARFGITSNCVSPAYMQTALTASTDERIVEELINNHPLKKLLSPNEVAETVTFLLLASSQINGINLIINAAAHVI